MLLALCEPLCRHGDAHALQGGDQCLRGKDGLRAVSRAPQSDDQAVAHQLVVTNPFDGRDILDPRAALGFLRLHESNGDKPGRGQRHPPPEGSIRTCFRLGLSDAQRDPPLLHGRIIAESILRLRIPASFFPRPLRPALVCYASLVSATPPSFAMPTSEHQQFFQKAHQRILPVRGVVHDSLARHLQFKIGHGRG